MTSTNGERIMGPRGKRSRRKWAVHYQSLKKWKFHRKSGLSATEEKFLSYLRHRCSGGPASGSARPTAWSGGTSKGAYSPIFLPSPMLGSMEPKHLEVLKLACMKREGGVGVGSALSVTPKWNIPQEKRTGPQLKKNSLVPDSVLGRPASGSAQRHSRQHLEGVLAVDLAGRRC